MVRRSAGLERYLHSPRALAASGIAVGVLTVLFLSWPLIEPHYISGNPRWISCPQTYRQYLHAGPLGDSYVPIGCWRLTSEGKPESALPLVTPAIPGREEGWDVGNRFEPRYLLIGFAAAAVTDAALVLAILSVRAIRGKDAIE